MISEKTEFDKLHSYVEESSGNEINICEITAIKNGSVVYEDYRMDIGEGMHLILCRSLRAS